MTQAHICGDVDSAPPGTSATGFIRQTNDGHTLFQRERDAFWRRIRDPAPPAACQTGSMNSRVIQRSNLQVSIRPAVKSDVDALEVIEMACFDAARRSSRQSLMRSVSSDKQRVGVAVTTSPEGQEEVIGAAVLFLYAKSIRLYSIGTLPTYRGCGAGEALLKWTFDHTEALDFRRLSLEADANNPRLLAWYQARGFTVEDSLPDYYAEGEHAVRLVRRFDQHQRQPRVVLITESPSLWTYALPNVTAISPSEYLSNDAWQRHETLRVINLCSSYSDQSLGYYTSLLAAARSHRITPDVIAIKDMVSRATRRRLSERYAASIQQAFEGYTEDELIFPIVFEQSLLPEHAQLAKVLSRSLGSPLLTLKLKRALVKDKMRQWHIQSIKPMGLREALKKYRDLTDAAAPVFFSKRRFQNIKLPSYRYDLAILVNPEEENAPSCPKALEQIQRAAERKGFYVERITAKDRKRLPEFDALLIRETTAVNHHTYRLSREAVAEGLVVIDDPWSILRCANKIFLYERLTRARIRQPKAWLFYAKSDWRKSHPELPFPLVIKRPEGCFSTGVFRVENGEELDAMLTRLFEEMDVVIGQEFLPSQFDWRIGILNHQPIFACKYYMATGHWQVYNWASETEGDDGFHQVGNSDCIPIDQVPAAVIQTAKRAAACIGNGLYGVDLKESDGKVYVIEVNDNPNIDAGVEDIIDGERLYDRIAEDLARRIEQERIHVASVTSQ